VTDLFKISDHEPFGQAPADDVECPCPEPDDQYLLEIEEGSLFLTHKACGKSPRGDWTDVFHLDQIPVTVQAHPYGNCDGSEWHGELRCDCGINLVATVNDRSVVHDNVPYLIGRAYTDRDGEQWQIGDDRNHAGQPLIRLLPIGSGEPAALAEIVAEEGPLTLAQKEVQS
jgi:hypothetical protein